MAPTANHKRQLGLCLSRPTPTDRHQRFWKQMLHLQLSPRTTHVSTALALQTRAPTPGGPRPLTHVCSTHKHTLRSTGGDTRGRGPPVGRGRQAQEGSRLGLLGWSLLCEA